MILKKLYIDEIHNPIVLFDSNNNEIYWEYNDGFWVKREFDSNNNRIYCEYSDGFWVKSEFDSNNNLIYYEDSDGTIRGKRPNKNKIWKLINNLLGR